MGITDMYYKNGNLKGAKAVAIAIKWERIQQELIALDWEDVIEILKPVLDYHTSKEE
tara:strand:+ start:20 stop:190 length:171 start_codon:yes stop_codon:yes gene_type:complete